MATKRPKTGTIDDATIEWDQVRVQETTVRVKTGDDGPPDYNPIFAEETTVWVWLTTKDSAGVRRTSKHDFSTLGTSADRNGANNLLQAALAAHIAEAYETP